jgi:CheY-like chemotaxis protein
MNQSGLETAKVLIVDDEAANTLLLERMLEMSGFPERKSTNDAEQAVNLFLEYRPDIVLLDLSMPKLDGFAVLEQLHSVIPVDEIAPISSPSHSTPPRSCCACKICSKCGGCIRACRRKMSGWN